MPLYDFRCDSKKCGKVVESYAKMDETTKKCDCGAQMTRLITTRFTPISDLEPYLDPHIGKEPRWIKSRQHREKVMREEGVYEASGKGWV